MRKPGPFRSLLFHAWLAVIADAVRKDGRKARFFGAGKCHLVIAEGDSSELAFQYIITRRAAGHRARAWEGRIQLAALSAAECLRFDDAFAGRRPAGVHQVGGLGAQDLA